MKKLSIKLKYCYGIKDLEKDFEFSNSTFSIYAPNGVMKTSFAKTFLDIQNNRDTQDLHFPDRETERDIKIDGNNIKENQIFVIEPYNSDYESDRLSTLLVNESLRKEYEKIYKEVEKSKKDLIKKLKQLSGLTGRKDDIEKKIEEIFNKNIFELFLDKEFLALINNEESKFDFIVDNLIFNDKVLKILKNSSFINDLKEYIEKYNELISKSKILQKNFTINHATTVKEQLKKNNFFNAGHYINLVGKGEIKGNDDFENILNEEKQKILEDSELLEKFEKINKKFSNQELKDFRNFLTENKEIIPYLENLDEFRKTIWVSYFIKEKDLIKNLIDTYIKSQTEIKRILQRAKKEETQWEFVVNQFNNRFSHLPFYLEIKNKEDVLLKQEAPSISFVFKDGNEKKEYIDKKDLIDKLSTGEKRALYILNIIFEIEGRKKEDQEILIIVDDIADSFDYKNKYAIIEYLKEISEFDKFYMIILTHNFDFFRTILSRAITKYNQCLIALKSEEKISLVQASYIKNPFVNDWKNNLSDNKKLVASIPFVRNLIEYTKGENDDYLRLTSCLHYKDNSDSIILNNLKDIFSKTIDDLNFPENNLSKSVIDFILETAEECYSDNVEGLNLENKIVLSIAIRLLAEKYMKEQIQDEGFLNDLNNKHNQTWILLKKYQEEFNNEKEKIELLKRVNLITSENIHLNSFMYEPILDMGGNELKKLYADIKDLYQPNNT